MNSNEKYWARKNLQIVITYLSSQQNPFRKTTLEVWMTISNELIEIWLRGTTKKIRREIAGACRLDWALDERMGNKEVIRAVLRQELGCDQ